VFAAPRPDGKIISLCEIFSSAVEKKAGFVQSTVLCELACCEKRFILTNKIKQIKKNDFFIKLLKVPPRFNARGCSKVTKI
jgi:hypothetical protein